MIYFISQSNVSMYGIYIYINSNQYKLKYSRTHKYVQASTVRRQSAGFNYWFAWAITKLALSCLLIHIFLSSFFQEFPSLLKKFAQLVNRSKFLA